MTWRLPQTLMVHVGPQVKTIVHVGTLISDCSQRQLARGREVEGRWGGGGRTTRAHPDSRIGKLTSLISIIHMLHLLIVSKCTTAMRVYV
ncbi:hypothetical protein EVAR_88704_1 [Eumeta japonica]|uniref:Uncharacterized protein n=1 Tax=Eumeta variegata TaxID=151549 RepID=A0A4C1Y507_EUMVA|nr:hypothetical protein EVAR_88704_1 [Eumeta japonica]